MNITKHLTLVVILFTISHSTFSQTTKRKNYFPIWTFHQENANIHGLSVGLANINETPKNTYTNGIKLELIGLGIIIPLIPSSPGPENDSMYNETMNQPISERINGVVLSLSGTVCDCSTNGFIIGAVGHINRQVNGASIALLFNHSTLHNGLQIALINDSYILNGVQIGGASFSEYNNGGQIGIYNKSTKTTGTQVGVVNKTNKLKGIQIGIWNVNEKRKMPFINWNFE